MLDDLSGNPTSGAVDLALMEPIYETYKDQPGALIPVLQHAQDVYGYLPREVLQWIADRFGVALGKVHGVATFYSQFYLQDRGRHELKLCNGTACHVKGAADLAAAVEDAHNVRPGETTDDGALTVETVYCLGSCALAPVAVLDGEIIGRVRENELLDEVQRRLASESGNRDEGAAGGGA